MKKLTLLSVVVASILIVGCGDETKEVATPVVEKATEKTVVEKATEVAKDAGKVVEEAVEKTVKVATEAKDAVVEKAVEAKEAVAEKVADAKSDSSSVDTKACAACHGAEFEKKAMNVSKIVKDMSKDDIIKALKGYKDGSYGGAMKALMKGQVASYDDAKIEAVASQIAK